MFSELEYGTFSNYSPRGRSEISQRSQQLRGKIKAGAVDTIQSIIPHLREKDAKDLSKFLSEDVAFVPIPQSAPIVAGAVWNSELIANTLHGAGFGCGVFPILVRKTAIRKSHLQTDADSRPSVQEHFDSLALSNQLLPSRKIVLVDDFVTQGRTAVACALKILEAMPDVEIMLFAIMRTQSTIPEITKLIDPSANVIKYFKSGKTRREDG